MYYILLDKVINFLNVFYILFLFLQVRETIQGQISGTNNKNVNTNSPNNLDANVPTATFNGGSVQEPSVSIGVDQRSSEA